MAMKGSRVHHAVGSRLDTKILFLQKRPQCDDCRLSYDGLCQQGDTPRPLSRDPAEALRNTSSKRQRFTGQHGI